MSTPKCSKNCVQSELSRHETKLRRSTYEKTKKTGYERALFFVCDVKASRSSWSK